MCCPHNLGQFIRWGLFLLPIPRAGSDQCVRSTHMGATNADMSASSLLVSGKGVCFCPKGKCRTGHHRRRERPSARSKAALVMKETRPANKVAFYAPKIFAMRLQFAVGRIIIKSRRRVRAIGIPCETPLALRARVFVLLSRKTKIRLRVGRFFPALFLYRISTLRSG